MENKKEQRYRVRIWAVEPSISSHLGHLVWRSEVLATNGDTHLGGDDFDKRVIDWIVDLSSRSWEGIDLQQRRHGIATAA
jgi:molecular chaperone DnaK (HSP70)